MTQTQPHTPSPPAAPSRRQAHGPHTWAMIREAYLAGTPAPHLSRVFGPSLPAIRKRAEREGWTRTAHAAAQERAHPLAAPAPPAEAPAAPLEPAAILASTLALANAHLLAGRDAQADAALRRGHSLARLAEAAQRLKPLTLADLEAMQSELWLKLVELAEHAAHKALTDPLTLPARLGDWAYRWRAEHLGPECAAADTQRRASFAR